MVAIFFVKNSFVKKMIGILGLWLRAHAAVFTCSQANLHTVIAQCAFSRHRASMPAVLNVEIRQTLLKVRRRVLILTFRCPHIKASKNFVVSHDTSEQQLFNYQNVGRLARGLNKQNQPVEYWEIFSDAFAKLTWFLKSVFNMFRLQCILYENEISH